MWRRILSSHLKTLAAAASPPTPYCRSALIRSSTLSLSANRSLISPSSAFVARHFSSDAANTSVKKRVEDVMPIATGHEREELEAELEGRDLLEINYPVGPFGTKVGTICSLEIE
ncbi:cytochrome c oxidase subunit 5b-2, mitochondrial-like [Carica papaya]|uniref:cytochrome c oxidase subunit 5b-2, mitochondrial-like n=1 Tax=Carica papaya TaxID=3649 RepID=UPI000B8C92D1|nr:cytochrome c oxidase subunit 5b-2, mitochondrial-like [Carica papaya]